MNKVDESSETHDGGEVRGGLRVVAIVVAAAAGLALVMFSFGLLVSVTSPADTQQQQREKNGEGEVVELPAGVPSGGVEVITDSNCREITFTVEEGNLAFRSRDFPVAWGPDTPVQGKFVAWDKDVGELIFESVEGDRVIFYGGADAIFTADCPSYGPVVGSTPEFDPPIGGGSPLGEQDPDRQVGGALQKVFVVGLPEQDAVREIEAAGLELRVVERDGKPFPATMDYRRDRVNLSIENGVVTNSFPG